MKKLTPMALLPHMARLLAFLAALAISRTLLSSPSYPTSIIGLGLILVTIAWGISMAWNGILFLYDKNLGGATK